VGPGKLGCHPWQQQNSVVPVFDVIGGFDVSPLIRIDDCSVGVLKLRVPKFLIIALKAVCFGFDLWGSGVLGTPVDSFFFGSILSIDSSWLGIPSLKLCVCALSV
jgi:hypothetical protein